MSYPLIPGPSGGCAEMEEILCDYLDGTLTADRKADVELHLAQCPACAAMARDSASAMAFISTAETVDAPPELLTRILFDPPWSKQRSRYQGLRSRIAGWLSPILQPRFAMGAAMTILSFSLLSQVTPLRQLRPSDLQPAKVWGGLVTRVDRVWDRSVKFYDNLKFVYQIQTTLREWQQQNDEQQPANKKQASPKPDEHKLPSNARPANDGNH